MKIRTVSDSSVCSQSGHWPLALILASCAGLLNAPSISAQTTTRSVERSVIVSGGGSGPGSGFAVSRSDGNGTGHFQVFMHGPEDTTLSEDILTASDTDKDGGATSAELSKALATWWAKADTDTNGVLSVKEVAETLKIYFPMPPIPAGFPAPPEDMSPGNLLARHLFTKADTDANGSLTYKEATTYLSQNYSQWDADANGSLNKDEIQGIIAELFAPDGSDQIFFSGGKSGSFTNGSGTVFFHNIRTK